MSIGETDVKSCSERKSELTTLRYPLHRIYRANWDFVKFDRGALRRTAFGNLEDPFDKSRLG